MRLYLDDVRPTPPGFDLRAYSYAQAIKMLETHHVSFISFDHDLGDPEAELRGEGSGYDVAKWIEERSFNRGMHPVGWAVHSANPVGAKNINAAMTSAARWLR